ncbi:unnamed protein product, partial [marine sediment metagenome]
MPVRRPLMWLALALIAGVMVSAGVLGPSPGSVRWASVLLAVGMGLLIGFYGRARAQFAVLAACFACAGVLLWQARHVGPPGDEVSRYVISNSLTNGTMEGRVWRPDLALAGKRPFRFFLDVDRIYVDDRPVACKGRVQVRWDYFDAPVWADERIRVEGSLKVALGRVNPGEGRIL